MTTVEPVTPANLEIVHAYLAAHAESSLYLINNLEAHGTALTEHPNSGNFKLILEGGRPAGVFSLTRRGNLIVRCDGEYSEVILRACGAEPVTLRGFLGDWDSISPVWSRFRAANPEFRPVLESKQILYARKLSPGDTSLRHDARARILVPDDFDQWLDFNTAFASEMSLPDDLPLKQKRAQFMTSIGDRVLWGLFDGPEMVCRIALNAKTRRMGQVGGVFTPRGRRRHGYARTLLYHALKDCRDLHGHGGSVLFTGEDERPAQKLYESMGYARIGFFGLVFG